jgi:FAD/FMN-containing dehydrogenase
MTSTTSIPDIEGRLLRPDSEGYDDARSVFNAMIERRPGLIAQCDTPADVVSSLRYARDAGLDLAVRGGGHSVAGTSVLDHGLVIDLRRMCDVVVDPAAGTVQVGGGATMSHLDRALQRHGLATTGGRVSSTGVGGFTLGGGTGWLDRKFGLACDNLVSVDLVTASGDLVTASENEHPELFWALHGGGGNFGVATSLTLRAYPLPTASAAMLFWLPEDAEQAIRTYRDVIESAGDETSGGAIYITAPPEEFVPEEYVGQLVLLGLVTHCGPEEELRGIIEPLRAQRPAFEAVMELPYADLNSMLDDPPGMRNYWSAEHLSALPDEAIAAFHGAVDSMLVPSSCQHVLFIGGGAAGRSTAGYPLPWRSAPWTAHPFAVWEDPADDEQCMTWTRSVRAAMKPWATGDVYLNFTGDEGPDRVKAGFGAENWDRLVAVKREFDPDNVFRHNHNIPPG